MALHVRIDRRSTPAGDFAECTVKASGNGPANRAVFNVTVMVAEDDDDTAIENRAKASAKALAQRIQSDR